MKPCRKRRKQITWLAINALGTAQAAELDQHLQQCNACRGYFEEIRRVQQRVSLLPSLVSSQTAAELSPPRDSRLIRLSTSHRDYFSRSELSHRLGWLLPLSGSVIVALVVLFTRSERTHVPAPGLAAPTEMSSGPGSRDFLPSFANYRAVGLRSWDRLDDLLAQQAQKAPQALPCPTAGTLELANLPD